MAVKEEILENLIVTLFFLKIPLKELSRKGGGVGS